MTTNYFLINKNNKNISILQKKYLLFFKVQHMHQNKSISDAKKQKQKMTIYAVGGQSVGSAQFLSLLLFFLKHYGVCNIFIND